MNIHEHQAKQLLKKYGAIVPNGVFAFTVKDLLEKVKILDSKKLCLLYTSPSPRDATLSRMPSSA